MLLVILFSVVVLFVINIFYRILVNQEKVVSLKARMKVLQDESNKYKNDPAKQKEYFSKMMDENRELTKLSFKPMIVSFAIIMVALPIVSILYADVYMSPVDQGNVTIDEVVYQYNIQGSQFMLSSDSATITCDISDCFEEVNGKYYRIVKEVKDGTEEIRMARIIAISPVTIPFVGKELAWIWFYVILSIPLSIFIKKLMGVKI